MIETTPPEPVRLTTVVALPGPVTSPPSVNWDAVTIPPPPWVTRAIGTLLRLHVHARRRPRVQGKRVLRRTHRPRDAIEKLSCELGEDHREGRKGADRKGAPRNGLRPVRWNRRRV